MSMEDWRRRRRQGLVIGLLGPKGGCSGRLNYACSSPDPASVLRGACAPFAFFFLASPA